MIVTLTGPSCAGKSTLEKRLKEAGMVNAISTTTRHMRKGEVNGEAYYFVSQHVFNCGLDDGSFIEHVEFGGNKYGMEKAEVERLLPEGKSIVIVCEPIGQKQIAKWCKENDVPIMSVFVDGDAYTIARRFLSRAADDIRKCSETESETKLNTYATRLTEMMTTERGWSAEAWLSKADGVDRYNLVLDRFDPTNDVAVVQQILNQVNLNKEQS